MPSAIARTGVPMGTAMSMPSLRPAAVRVPKPATIVPRTGHANVSDVAARGATEGAAADFALRTGAGFGC